MDSALSMELIASTAGESLRDYIHPWRLRKPVPETHITPGVVGQTARRAPAGVSSTLAALSPLALDKRIARMLLTFGIYTLTGVLAFLLSLTLAMAPVLFLKRLNPPELLRFQWIIQALTAAILAVAFFSHLIRSLKDLWDLVRDV